MSLKTGRELGKLNYVTQYSVYQDMGSEKDYLAFKQNWEKIVFDNGIAFDPEDWKIKSKKSLSSEGLLKFSLEMSVDIQSFAEALSGLKHVKENVKPEHSAH